MNGITILRLALPIVGVLLFIPRTSYSADNPQQTMKSNTASTCTVADPAACASACILSCDPKDCVVTTGWSDPGKGTSASLPTDSELKDLSEKFSSIRAKYKVPALVGAVARGSGPIAAGISGVKAAGSAKPVELADKFHLGSCTKALTATLAARLVEQGELSFQTTLADAYPSIVDQINPEFRSVTLIELLSHRSGLPQLERSSMSELWNTTLAIPGTPTVQRKELVRLVLQKKSSSVPGSTYEYSDLGYVLAAAMMEEITGATYESLVESLIAQPLGITTLGFGTPGVAGEIDQPRGHLVEENQLKPLDPRPQGDLAAPVISPAGTVHMSITDWSKFAAFQLNGLAQDGTRLLNEESLELLHRDRYHQHYALGWGVSEVAWASGNVYSHTGSCGAWSAVVWLIPDHDLVMVAASNLGGANGLAACNDAVEVMKEAYLSAGRIVEN